MSRHIGSLRHPVTRFVKAQYTYTQAMWREYASYCTHNVTCNTVQAKASEPVALNLLRLIGESGKDSVLILAAVARLVPGVPMR